MSYAYDIDQAANLLVIKFWGAIPYAEEAEACDWLEVDRARISWPEQDAS